MIFNILDNTTELWMTKYIIGEIFSSGGANLYKSYSDQTVSVLIVFLESSNMWKSTEQNKESFDSSKAKVCFSSCAANIAFLMLFYKMLWQRLKTKKFLQKYFANFNFCWSSSFLPNQSKKSSMYFNMFFWKKIQCNI